MIDFRRKRILVVVAHPDDELLGLGGTIHQLINTRDCKVRAVILGEGITSRSETRDRKKWESELAVHRENIESARECIGYESVGVYDFPDNRFDSVELLDIVKVVEKEKMHFKPDLIFTHHGGDLNIDHQRTFEAVVTACRPMNGESVKAILTFETMSGTEWQAVSDPRKFAPNIFLEISEEDLSAKVNAMDCYEYEKREYPHPRSSNALRNRAEMWGIQNGIGMAEAFQLIRYSGSV